MPLTLRCLNTEDMSIKLQSGSFFTSSAISTYYRVGRSDSFRQTERRCASLALHNMKLPAYSRTTMFKAAFIVAFTIFVTVQQFLIALFYFGGGCHDFFCVLLLALFAIILAFADAIIFGAVVRSLKKAWLFYVSLLIALIPILFLLLSLVNAIFEFFSELF